MHEVAAIPIIINKDIAFMFFNWLRLVNSQKYRVFITKQIVRSFSVFGFLDFDVSVCFQIGNGKIICAYIGSWQ